jgi:hypothetical protein
MQNVKAGFADFTGMNMKNELPVTGYMPRNSFSTCPSPHAYKTALHWYYP